MKKILSILVLMALTPLAFAQYECEESCCYSYAGTWDDDFHMCNDHNVGYLNCVDECLYGSSDDVSFDYSYSCCGPAFMLIGLVGAAFLANRR